jgi:hypothetical protein
VATAYVLISPNAGIAPADSPALWKRVVDTNPPNKPVIEYADADENYDYLLPIPAWASGGTLRIYWRVNSATTNAVRWQAQTTSRADVDASDVAFVNLDVANFANGAATALIVNIDTLTLATSGWGSNELLYLRISRNGTNAGDTLSGIAVQFLFAVLEYTT